jgi:cyclopropane fatty-acyl-phospholipid synthase-like methyltransferase
MGEVKTGLRKMLSTARYYDLSQTIVGAEEQRAIFVRDHLRPTDGARILDIGCGTCAILSHLPSSVEYIGVDSSPSYIEAARNRYGNRGRFECAVVSEDVAAEFGRFDIVVALGLIHHLDDSRADELFAVARKLLIPPGRFVSLDACYVDGQSPIARWLMSWDRGQNVRDVAGYQSLARARFSNVKATVRHNLLRVPSSHLILECH